MRACVCTCVHVHIWLCVHVVKEVSDKQIFEEWIER